MNLKKIGGFFMKGVVRDDSRSRPLGDHISFAIQDEKGGAVLIQEDGRFAPEDRRKLKIIIFLDAGENMLGVNVCGQEIKRRRPDAQFKERTYAIPVRITQGKPQYANDFAVFTIEKKQMTLRKLIINPGEGWWTLELTKESLGAKFVDSKVLEALGQSQIAA